MPYRPVKGAIWARRYLSEVRKWRTIKNNKFQRLMQHIPVKGAIWARRYLRKTQKLCFSLSIRKDRLFIRKVVLIQTNFRRNLLCEAKWAVGIKTTAQSGEVSGSVPHLQGYGASKRISYNNCSPSLRKAAECKHDPNTGLYCSRAGNFILCRLLFLFCENQYSIQNA